MCVEGSLLRCPSGCDRVSWRSTRASECPETARCHLQALTTPLVTSLCADPGVGGGVQLRHALHLHPHRRGLVPPGHVSAARTACCMALLSAALLAALAALRLRIAQSSNACAVSSSYQPCEVVGTARLMQSAHLVLCRPHAKYAPWFRPVQRTAQVGWGEQRMRWPFSRTVERLTHHLPGPSWPRHTPPHRTA